MTSRYGAALSEHPHAAEAAGELGGALLDQVGARPDLVVVFASGHHADELPAVADTLQMALGPAHLVGTTASGVVGGDQELEERTALTAWAGHVGAGRSMHLSVEPSDEGAHLVGWPGELGPSSALLMLADPFSFPADGVVAALADHHPGLPVLGGLASAGSAPGTNTLVLDDTVHHSGAACVALGPEARVTPLVSQGCRPIGQPMVVTAAEGNVVSSLAGRPAVDRLREVLEELAPADRERAAGGLHVGLVVDEHRADFASGDFLVRNVVGADPEAGTIAIGDVAPVGTTVQFQVRDAASADDDLRRHLRGRHAAGALLFTCNGRGRRLFGQPDHDARLAAEALGAPALAGMFCAGEIGPVGPASHLHGFTASLLLFDE